MVEKILKRAWVYRAKHTRVSGRNTEKRHRSRQIFIKCLNSKNKEKQEKIL